MFARLAHFVSRYWPLVLLAWVIVAVGVHWVAPRWDDVTQDGDFAYLPPNMTSVRGQHLLDRAFPNLESKSQVVLIAARPDGPLTADDMEVVRRLAAEGKDLGERFKSKDEKGAERQLLASVWTPDDDVIGKKLVSPKTAHGQAALVMLNLRSDFSALGNIDLLKEIYRKLDEIASEADFPPGLQLGATGSAGVGADMLISAQESIESTELTTVLLVVIILLLVYRAPGLVIVPLVTIVVSLQLSTDLAAWLALLGQRARESQRTLWFDYMIFRTTKIFVVVILYGAATDYCLFLISRYREELQRGHGTGEAIQRALGSVGGAVAASAMTVILGLATMVFADFRKFRYGGATNALALTVALVACLTLAPALLRLAGRWVFWPFGSKLAARAKGGAAREPDDDDSAASQPGLMAGLWAWIGRAIVARPGLILAGSVVVLALPVYLGLTTREITYDLVSDLSPNRPSVQGIRLLGRYFPAGETGPVTVLVRWPEGTFGARKQDGELFQGTREGEDRIFELTKLLFATGYTDAAGRSVQPIVSVRSLTNPLGNPPRGGRDEAALAGWRRSTRDIAMTKNRRVREIFLAQAPEYQGTVSRLDLVAQYDPFSRESMNLFNSIENRLLELSRVPLPGWYEAEARRLDIPAKVSADGTKANPWHGMEFDFVGTTPGIRDLEAVNVSDYLLVGVLTSLAVMAVLVLLLRRVLICIYLVVTVLVGYFATLGITRVLFTWLYGEAFHGLDWKLPIYLFVILVAVGEDYNIYLASRVFEEQRRRGLLEGLRVAVLRTGGIITSCGVIMAGTFASMLTGTMRGMHELGFALSFGILLDTFLIRTIVVPAFLALWARWFPGEKAAAPAVVPDVKKTAAA